MTIFKAKNRKDPLSEAMVKTSYQLFDFAGSITPVSRELKHDTRWQESQVGPDERAVT